MRIQATVFCFFLSLFSVVVFAGANHDHGHSHSHDPVSQTQAEKAAIKSIANLIKKGKVDSSWKSIPVSKSEKKKFGDKMEWVVSFKNDKVSDASKQTLYVFLSLTGEYIAANYTGK